MAIHDMDAIKLFYLTLRIITPVDSVRNLWLSLSGYPDMVNANLRFIDD